MIILASKSPRRRELLGLCGVEFDVKTTEADETLPENISPEEAVCMLSRIKAEALSDKENIIIGADTVVAVDNEILGKPKDREDAILMLSKLSGRAHSVYTGVTLMKGDEVITFCEETKVEFYELSRKEIEDYVATGECDDKAGSYGIQGLGGLLCRGIEGDYNNVVGLPVARLFRELKKLL